MRYGKEYIKIDKGYFQIRNQSESESRHSMYLTADEFIIWYSWSFLEKYLIIAVF